MRLIVTVPGAAVVVALVSVTAHADDDASDEIRAWSARLVANAKPPRPTSADNLGARDLVLWIGSS